MIGQFEYLLRCCDFRHSLISGPKMPKALSFFSAVELEGDLYTIGGWSPEGKKHQKEIQKLSCSSHVCTWTTIAQHLRVARSHTVAIPMMDSVCIPN